MSFESVRKEVRDFIAEAARIKLNPDVVTDLYEGTVPPGAERLARMASELSPVARKMLAEIMATIDQKTVRPQGRQ